MIAANEGVTEWIMDRNWPFIYRVHEEPALDALEKFSDLAATVGLDIPVAEGSFPQGHGGGREKNRRTSGAISFEHVPASIDEASDLQRDSWHSLRFGVTGLYALY